MWKDAPPSMMYYSRSSIEDLGREMLPLPGYRVVMDERTSIEPPFSFCKSPLEVLRLSLELLLQNVVPSLHDRPSVSA